MRGDVAAAAASLLLESAILTGLRLWPPVGGLIDELPAALRGQGQLTDEQCRRLRKWARRWRAVSSHIRNFYSGEVMDAARDGKEPDGLISAALWRILDGADHAFTTRQEQGLRMRWRERYGSFPASDLCPRLPEIKDA